MMKLDGFWELFLTFQNQCNFLTEQKNGKKQKTMIISTEKDFDRILHLPDSKQNKTFLDWE